MKKTKKHSVSPEAAKILEQYRNAGKPQPAEGENGGLPAENDGTTPPPRSSAPPPGAAPTRQRSGTRGK